MLRLALLALLLGSIMNTPSLAAGAVGAEAPPIFDRRPYEEAKADAAEEGKWFIVKATAVWCAPCKHMDRTTWRDEQVVAWIRANAIAVQVDVDKEKEVAKALGTRAMPTMIAFKNGEEEFDRIVGYKDGPEFLVWLEGIARGEKAIEVVKERAAAQPKGGKAEVDARYELARSLLQTGNFDNATEEFAWVWEHSRGVPSYGGVRTSFLTGSMGKLARQHAPAKERFTAFRDAKAEAITGEKVDWQDLNDWMALNDVVDDNERTLAWFDTVRADPRWSSLVSRVSFRIERLLIASNRWADVASLYPDPLAKLHSEHQKFQMMAKMPLPAQMDEIQRKEMLATRHHIFRAAISQLYAGLLAADREAEATLLASKARELAPDNALDLALVDAALRAREPRMEQVSWLKDAADDDSRAMLDRLKAELAAE